VPRIAREGDHLIVAWTNPGAMQHDSILRTATLPSREVPIK
jgi:hypothetical protein